MGSSTRDPHQPGSFLSEYLLIQNFKLMARVSQKYRRQRGFVSLQLFNQDPPGHHSG